MNSLDKMEEESPINRAKKMLILAGRYIEEHYPDGTIHYDGTDCDGYCVAVDCATAAEGLVEHANSKHSAILEDYDRLAKLAEKQAEEIERLQQQVAMLAELFCVHNITAAAQKYFKEHDAKVRAAYRKELLPKMVDRFLSWKLPKDFSPDGGITFTAEYNKEYMESLGKPPSRHEPVGTNLFSAAQAEDMCAVLLGGMSDEQVDEMVTKLRVSFFKGDRK